MTNEVLPHNEQNMTAAISPVALVTMWKEGASISVSPDAVETLRRQGWSERDVGELSELVSAIQQYSAAFSSSVSEFVTEVMAKGMIDSHDGATYAAAQTAKRMMDQVFADILLIAHSTFPIGSTSEPVVVSHNGAEMVIDQSQTAMIDTEGNLKAVDPNQVSHLESVGWRRA